MTIATSARWSVSSLLSAPPCISAGGFQKDSFSGDCYLHMSDKVARFRLPEPSGEQYVTLRASDYDELIEAAACVANAIAVGAGGCIQGTLMESELRAALKLAPGVLVGIPKRCD